MGWSMSVVGLANNEARHTERLWSKVGGYGCQPFFAAAFLGCSVLADLPDSGRVRHRWVRPVWVGPTGSGWARPDYVEADWHRWYMLTRKGDFEHVLTTPYLAGDDDEGIGVIAVEQSINLGIKMKRPAPQMAALGEFALQVMRTPRSVKRPDGSFDYSGNDMAADLVPALAAAFEAIEPHFDRLPGGWGEQLHEVNLVIRTAAARGLGLTMG